MRAPVWLWLIAGLLLVGGGAVVYTQTRGLRNNNPGNIRRTADRWQGMAEIQSDPEFVTFIDMKYGVRAMAVILRNYRRQGVTTLQSIVARWAPSNENDTEAYINSVSRSTGIPRVAEVTEGDFPALIAAMSKVENAGFAPTMATIQEGISLA